MMQHSSKTSKQHPAPRGEHQLLVSWRGRRRLFFCLLAIFGTTDTTAFKDCPHTSTTVSQKDVLRDELFQDNNVNGCLCAPDEATGLYGTVTSYKSIVTYRYNLYINPSSTSSSKIATDVLPLLESDFSRAILVHLFPEECSIRESSDVEGVVGLSTLGVDTIIDTETCRNEGGSTTTESGACFLVDGQLTVYFNDSSSSSSSQAFKDSLHDLIVKKILLQGGLNGDFVTDDIERISIHKNDNESSSSQHPPWYLHVAFLSTIGIIGGILVCSCIIALAIAASRRRTDKAKLQANTLPQPNDDDDGDSLDSIRIMSSSSDDDNYSYESD